MLLGSLLGLIRALQWKRYPGTVSVALAQGTRLRLSSLGVHCAGEVVPFGDAHLPICHTDPSSWLESSSSC